MIKDRNEKEMKSNRNEKDLTEAEEIMKRWQEHREELYKKDLNDPDNDDGVITHLEPDILDCEVKWALGSITMNKADGGDGIPAKLFQILKDDAVKVLHPICQQIWKLGTLIGLGHLSFSEGDSFSRVSRALRTTLSLVVKDQLPHRSTTSA